MHWYLVIFLSRAILEGMTTYCKVWGIRIGDTLKRTNSMLSLYSQHRIRKHYCTKSILHGNLKIKRRAVGESVCICVSLVGGEDAMQ